jgi:hypothetical protein
MNKIRIKLINNYLEDIYINIYYTYMIGKRIKIM